MAARSQFYAASMNLIHAAVNFNLLHFHRYGHVACVRAIAEKAPYLVNARDAEGNTPHMLSYKHPAGVPCWGFLGNNYYKILRRGLIIQSFFYAQIKSVTSLQGTTKENHGLIC